MNRRYLFLAALIIVIILVLPVAAKTVWSIADPSDPANADLIAKAEAEGFWNFAYDDAAPYTTAGLYCCWWERWYKWQKFSTWKENTMNLGSSEPVTTGTSASSSVSQVLTESFTPSTAQQTYQEKAPVSASPTLTQIQPEDGYCPSCCSICDDDTAMALQARSDEIMAKKPWLTEGKNKAATATVTPVPTVAQTVMTFSDAK